MNILGACLRAGFFPLKQINEVEIVKIQVFLRKAFESWGLPKQIRLDNGQPFRTTSRDMPSLLVLWLTGLGIDVIFNKVHTPQQNGVVENHNGLTARWSQAHTRNSVEDLQKAINQVKQKHLYEFPVVTLNGKTRMSAFPDLLQNQRKYRNNTFVFQRVLDFLSLFCWVRIVDKTGSISLFHQKIFLGKKWIRNSVSISLNANTGHFTAYDEQASSIKQFDITSLTNECVQNLTVFQKVYLKDGYKSISP
jgi:hypothetical protein